MSIAQLDTSNFCRIWSNVGITQKKYAFVFSKSFITEWCIRNITIAILEKVLESKCQTPAVEFIIRTHAVDKRQLDVGNSYRIVRSK